MRTNTNNYSVLQQVQVFNLAVAFSLSLFPSHKCHRTIHTFLPLMAKHLRLTVTQKK